MTKTETEFADWADEIIKTLRKCLHRSEATVLAAEAGASIQLFLHQLGSVARVWEKSFEGLFPKGGVVIVNPLFPKNTALQMEAVERALGAMVAIKREIEKGRLAPVEDRLVEAVLADLVTQADDLIAKKYLLAASVVLRAVLEERLRKLCDAKALSLPSKPTIEHYKQALRKAAVIDKIVEKQIDWLAGVGNSAAHNLPEFNPLDVPNQYKGTIDFLAKFSA